MNERLITLELEIGRKQIVIFGVYSPTEDASAGEKDQFYDVLKSEIEQINNRKELIIMGDLNGRVGKKIKGKVVGRYREDIVNDNGIRLIETCEESSLKIMNGFFPHKRIPQYTWTQSTRNLRSIIDYVIVRQNTK